MGRFTLRDEGKGIVVNPVFIWKRSVPGSDTVTVTIPKDQCPRTW